MIFKLMIKPSTNIKSYMPIISKAKGKYVWDNKGNKYLDFTGSSRCNYWSKEYCDIVVKRIQDADGNFTQ